MSFRLKRSRRVWLGEFAALTDAGFTNGCSCRLHGQSSIVPDGLNLALHVGDDVELVLANRRLYAAALRVDPDGFTTCAQVHGTKVVAVTKELVGSGALAYADTIADTDALITDLPDVPLLLFYADCVPVLLADTKTGAVGLAHAGWRGSVGEIALQTALAMQKQYGCKPQHLLAAIGPSIGSCCYEVDDVVLAAGAKYSQCFTPNKNGKYQLDLWLMNRLQLEAAGLAKEHIYCAETCTCEEKELFFSYRAEAGKTGRMGVSICRR
ncbi:peptidoglycan editing factor PgeF [uncultured Phascolarctobacterium sp.]|uniref:peptidoglycan editing factor PgeF n=1 Tax=uncultured Phascolarctobacterium sp. TaxID=512296 RepID=UPI0015AF0958|nr:peptidoglycan editing factor PgeF [uncultured Phascolarctobacterium sp.]